MIYLKSYCYSEHEIDFIKAQLIESEGYVDKLVLYEYNVTHRGKSKPFRLREHIEALDPKLKSRILYRPVDIEHLCQQSDDEQNAHINEDIQRSYFFNDDIITIQSNDIIFDLDIDEIIYKRCYPILIFMARFLKIPIGIRLNQFFYKANYYWRSSKFRSPVVYRYGAYFKKQTRYLLEGYRIEHQRNYILTTPFACGAHLSWVMPVEMMVRKIHSYAHTGFEKYADINVLKQAIKNKQYIFDDKRKFDIVTLKGNSKMIPSHFHEKV
jgi:hypothetical protein